MPIIKGKKEFARSFKRIVMEMVSFLLCVEILEIFDTLIANAAVKAGVGEIITGTGLNQKWDSTHEVVT